MIENVEKLGPELNVERVGDSPDVSILNQGKIQINERRPGNCVSPVASDELIGGDPVTDAGKLEAVGIEELVHMSGRRVVAPRHSNREGIRIRIPVSHGIARNKERGWLPRLGSHNSAHLPSVQEPSGMRWRKVRIRKVPHAVYHQILRRVKVRDAPAALIAVKPQTGNRVDELVAEHRSGAGISDLAPGIGTLHLEAMTEPLSHGRFKSVEHAGPAPIDAANVP